MQEKSQSSDKQQLDITTSDGIKSFDVDDLQKMHQYLSAYFHQSQMNGTVIIDSYDRNVLKKLLKLDEKYK